MTPIKQGKKRLNRTWEEVWAIYPDNVTEHAIREEWKPLRTLKGQHIVEHDYPVIRQTRGGMLVTQIRGYYDPPKEAKRVNATWTDEDVIYNEEEEADDSWMKGGINRRGINRWQDIEMACWSNLAGFE